MNIEGEPSEMDRLTTEYLELASEYDTALRDPDPEVAKAVQDRRQKLLDEIRKIDPTFELREAA